MQRFLWTQKQDIGPLARSRFGLDYDSVRNVTYLFGGQSAIANAAGNEVKFSNHADTWAWDGHFWTQIARFGPSARSGHTMTFDVALGNTILFGGATERPESATWAFDGVEWTQVADIGPSARWDHAAAYDSGRRRIVLFGGVVASTAGFSYANDTWEWDGETWTQVDASGPSRRHGHAMAFDKHRNRTILFGGQAVGADGVERYVHDTWEWDGDTWTEVADTGPSARSDVAMTSTGAVLVLHGGRDDNFMADTWQWVNGTWSKVQEMGPSPRSSHALAYDGARQKLVLFGGDRRILPNATVSVGDTWEAPGTPSAPAMTGYTNLLVRPGTVSLGSGQGVTVDFDIAMSLGSVSYVVILNSGSGTRAPLTSSVVPAGTTHATVFVSAPVLASVANILGIQPPTTVGLTTSLGAASFTLQLLP